MDLSQLGRFVLVAAAGLGVVGLVLLAAGALGLGRLPGDLSWRRGNVSVFAPIGTMILLSLVATVVLNLFLRR